MSCNRIDCPLQTTPTQWDISLTSCFKKPAQCATVVEILSINRKLLIIILLLLGRVAVVRGAAAYSDQTFPWTICRSVCPVHCRKMADRIRPFGIVGRTGPGMTIRQVRGLGISPREGVLLGVNLGRAIVTNGDYTAPWETFAATRPSSQITLGRLIIILLYCCRGPQRSVDSRRDAPCDRLGFAHCAFAAWRVEQPDTPWQMSTCKDSVGFTYTGSHSSRLFNFNLWIVILVCTIPILRFATTEHALHLSNATHGIGQI